jgi:uncharacterized membrane protein YdjX (TVP38/TMEM64 family)
LTKPRRRVRKRLLLILGLALLLLAMINPAFRFSLFLEWVSIDRIVGWVELARANKILTGAFFVFYAIGVMILPITLFPIVGGVLLNFWLALPLNMVAATLGGWLSFRVGRFCGRSVVEPFMKGNLKALDRLAASQGIRTVFLLRLIGVPPFIVTNYGLGLSAVRNRDFISGTVIGMFPWMTMVTYMSTALWSAVQVGGEKGMMRALVKAMLPLTTVSTLVMIGVIGTWLVRRYRERAATRTYNQTPRS